VAERGARAGDRAVADGVSFDAFPGVVGDQVDATDLGFRGLGEGEDAVLQRACLDSRARAAVAAYSWRWNRIPANWKLEKRILEKRTSADTLLRC
jgi:hypothetical protein